MSVMIDSMKGAALVRDVAELSAERDASNDTLSRASGLTGNLTRRCAVKRPAKRTNGTEGTRDRTERRGRVQRTRQ